MVEGWAAGWGGVESSGMVEGWGSRVWWGRIQWNGRGLGQQGVVGQNPVEW